MPILFTAVFGLVALLAVLLIWVLMSGPSMRRRGGDGGGSAAPVVTPPATPAKTDTPKVDMSGDTGDAGGGGE